MRRSDANILASSADNESCILWFHTGFEVDIHIPVYSVCPSNDTPQIGYRSYPSSDRASAIYSFTYTNKMIAETPRRSLNKQDKPFYSCVWTVNSVWIFQMFPTFSMV